MSSPVAMVDDRRHLKISVVRIQKYLTNTMKTLLLSCFDLEKIQYTKQFEEYTLLCHWLVIAFQTESMKR